MSNHNYPRRLLDDAIDRAVQELVCAEPRPGLRRRVLDRLNAPPAPRSWVPRLLVPAGAIAAAVMLAILLKPAQPAAPVTPTSVAHTPAQTAPAVPAAPPSVIPVDRPPPKVARRTPPASAIFGTPTGRVSATSVGDAPAGVPIEKMGGEVAPARLDVMSGIAPIAIPSISIRPIEVKEIK